MIRTIADTYAHLSSKTFLSLFQVLERVRYVLIGGFAVILYATFNGVRKR